MKKETTKEAYLKKIMTTPIDDNCPVKRTLEILSGKWRMNVIYELWRIKEGISENY